jgi:hypothetical protein
MHLLWQQPARFAGICSHLGPEASEGFWDKAQLASFWNDICTRLQVSFLGGENLAEREEEGWGGRPGDSKGARIYWVLLLCSLHRRRRKWGQGFQCLSFCRKLTFLPPSLPAASALNTGISRPQHGLSSTRRPAALGWAPAYVRTCLMLKGRVIFFIAEQISPRHQGVAEGWVGQECAVCHWVQHHPRIVERPWGSMEHGFPEATCMRTPSRAVLGF